MRKYSDNPASGKIDVGQSWMGLEIDGFLHREGQFIAQQTWPKGCELLMQSIAPGTIVRQLLPKVKSASNGAEEDE